MVIQISENAQSDNGIMKIIVIVGFFILFWDFRIGERCFFLIVLVYLLMGKLGPFRDEFLSIQSEY
jgi:chromate transport protein ChrA